MTPGDLQELLEKRAEDAAARRPADHARGARRRGGGGAHLRHSRGSPREGRQLASELLERRLARDALPGRDAVAEEQEGVGLEHPEQLQRDGRVELGVRDDPQRLSGGRLSSSEGGGEREEQLVEEAGGEQLGAR